MQAIKIKASTHQVYTLNENQQRKTGRFDCLAMALKPDQDKCFVFRVGESYALIGREISFDDAVRL